MSGSDVNNKAWKVLWGVWLRHGENMGRLGTNNSLLGCRVSVLNVGEEHSFACPERLTGSKYYTRPAGCTQIPTP